MKKLRFLCVILAVVMMMTACNLSTEMTTTYDSKGNVLVSMESRIPKEDYETYKDYITDGTYTLKTIDGEQYYVSTETKKCTESTFTDVLLNDMSITTSNDNTVVTQSKETVYVIYDGLSDDEAATCAMFGVNLQVIYSFVFPSEIKSTTGTIDSDNKCKVTFERNGLDELKSDLVIFATTTDKTIDDFTIKTTDIELSRTTCKLVSGKTKQIKAVVYPTYADNKSVKWTSSNKKVATVNSAGKVTAKKAGKAVITCTSKDGSGVKAKCTIIVKPKAVQLKKVRNLGNNKLKVTWKAQSGVSGYQVIVATNKKFTKNKKTVRVKGAANTSKVIKKLKAGKTYYAKVRAYKVINGKRVYGKWSSYNKVKVTK
ncbi:MAG: Ig-like domain-containing protein [Eubacterium sp.]